MSKTKMQYEVASVSGEAGPPVATSRVAWAQKMISHIVHETEHPECTTNSRYAMLEGIVEVLTATNVIHLSACAANPQRPSEPTGQQVDNLC